MPLRRTSATPAAFALVALAAFACAASNAPPSAAPSLDVPDAMTDGAPSGASTSEIAAASGSPTGSVVVRMLDAAVPTQGLTPIPYPPGDLPGMTERDPYVELRERQRQNTGAPVIADAGPPPKMPAPSIVFEPTTVSAGLSLDAVVLVLRKYLTRIRACYETGLRLNPELRGRVTTDFTIGKDGDVMTMADGPTDLSEPNVSKCVRRAVGMMKFPAPTTDEVHVRAPILFAPGNAPKK